MDQNNNPLNPPAGTAGPVNNPAQVPTEMPLGNPLPPPTTAPSVSNSGGSKKMMILIVILLLLGILGVGGYYLYSSKEKTDALNLKVDIQAQQELTALGEELDKIEITDPEEDLTEVDVQIKELEATPSLR